MTDYSALHLTPDLPPVFDTPDLLGAGGPPPEPPARTGESEPVATVPAARRTADNAAEPGRS